MGVYASPNIVEDGLVLHLDAANKRSYEGSGTTWSDLSGNGNDGEVINGTIFDEKNFIFDGVNDRIIVADNNILDLAGNKTLTCWVFMTAATSAGICGKSNSTVKGMSLGYGFNGNGFMALAWNSSNTPFIARDLNRDINKWVFLSAVQNGSNRTIYVLDSLGLRTSSSTFGVHTWNNSQSFWIGSLEDNSYKIPSNSKISSISIFNRALSQSEIEQNFKATRKRFGI